MIGKNGIEKILDFKLLDDEKSELKSQLSSIINVSSQK